MRHVNNSLLVVDDNDVNRDMLSRRLEKQGYTVAVACDGRQALELMAVEDFDLVLLDIMMPEMDGFAVLDRMKSDPKLNDTPVMMLTAMNESRSVIRCIELGATDYIVKPFDMVALRNRITRCLLNRRSREEIQENVDWTGGVPPSILVIEDDELSRELLQKRMSRAGYHVVSLADGQMVEAALQDQNFDLVLSDIMMPGVNGFQVLEIIKQNEALKHLPVIMISALDDQESIDKCINLGAEDYITKPFNALLMKARVLSVLQSKRIQDKERARLESLQALSEEGKSYRS